MGLKTSLFRFRRRSLSEPKKEDILSDEELIELWTKCPECKAMLYNADLRANLKVCPKCAYHFRIGSYDRIEQLADAGSWEELFSSVKTADPLKFSDLRAYAERVEQARRDSGSSEAIITGKAKLNSIDAGLAVMEFNFMGGSMGSVVGERLSRLCDYCIKEKLPLILFSTSGGARMQEGLVSLLQMAKTSSALQRLRENKLIFISVLLDPTYGGVSASFAMLGDIIIAEPGAKIGFAGPRVIEETIRQKLPKDFQTSEYLLEHGQIDLITDRHSLKATLSKLLRMHSSVN